jgi:hypothetical protein
MGIIGIIGFSFACFRVVFRSFVGGVEVKVGDCDGCGSLSLCLFVIGIVRFIRCRLGRRKFGFGDGSNRDVKVFKVVYGND